MSADTTDATGSVRGVPHFLELADLDPAVIAAIARRAREPRGLPLEKRGVALLFEKPSARTRHSMEIAVAQLGGHPVYVRPDEVGLDDRELVEDVARVLGRYHALIAARVFEHSVLERLAAVSAVPIVNLLSDRCHPIQALADLITIHDEFGSIENVSLAYVGDPNNVAFSLCAAGALTGLKVLIASPAGYDFTDEQKARLSEIGATHEMTHDPREAVAHCQVIYTDSWVSMGQEAEAEQRINAFKGFGVDQALLACAPAGAIVMHCLPAHRGLEISSEVMDGPSSRIWDQAENRLHSARMLLGHLANRALESR